MKVIYELRRLTPEECFLAMGMTHEDYEKCRALGISETALYKQAGNGIVTNCVQLIAQHIYKGMYNQEYMCDDEIRRGSTGESSDIVTATT